MSKTEENVLILCDGEEEYAQLMSEYMKKQKNLPWNVRTYTDVRSFLEMEKDKKITVLAVSESMYCEEFRQINAGKTVLLNESGLIKQGNLKNINKYQAAEQVIRELLEAYAEIAGESLPKLNKSFSTRFIGLYSPIRRCLQTGLAITMGELLAKEHSVLYLNFEYCAGDPELLQMQPARDLSDLLYFMSAQKEKFALHMQIVMQHRNGMDYIPPMRAGQNLLTVTAGEWVGFMQRIEELGEYEYVIMDLSESMQGLYDILRLCERVYTITRNDRIARSKLLQYEQLLSICEYEDVLQKTIKCALPVMDKIPDSLEQYDRWELADYARELLEKRKGGV